MVAKCMSEPETVALERRQFTIREYQRLGEAGILDEDERVELWEGEIVLMAPIDSDHSGSVSDFNMWLVRSLPDTVIVRIQDVLHLPPCTAPQPDVAVVRYRRDRYHTRHPEPEDTLLVIEVARTSLRYDREEKVARYALAGIPEVWILDSFGRRLLVYREPHDGRYMVHFTLGSNDMLAPAAFPNVAIRVAQVLG